jgi:hypothetical protein
MYKCNACGWKCPADTIGAALMKQHLKDAHGHTVK